MLLSLKNYFYSIYIKNTSVVVLDSFWDDEICLCDLECDNNV